MDDERSAVHVRDSKDREGPVLSFGRSSFAAFVADLKAGTLDLVSRR